jgi:8-oxo-dGTP diphosphatase
MLTVVAAIIEREGKLLVCQRKRGRNFELKWEFPGGKVEPGETPQAALARELQEELGVHAEIGAEIYRTRHQYKELPQEFELIFLSATIADAAQVTNLEFERIEWRAPESLVALDFLSADRELVQNLATGKLRVNNSDPE